VDFVQAALVGSDEHAGVAAVADSLFDHLASRGRLTDAGVATKIHENGDFEDRTVVGRMEAQVGFARRFRIAMGLALVVVTLAATATPSGADPFGDYNHVATSPHPSWAMSF